MSDIVVEVENMQRTNTIEEVIVDGKCAQKLKQNMLSGSSKWTDDKINKVFGTAFTTVAKFPATSGGEIKKKILCLGKVQSGKTAFFISTMAMAMDNGYNLIYVLGGTKNNLLDQNKGRIRKEFSNNGDVFITGINTVDPDDVRQKVAAGIKVVIMVLKGKNVNADKNLMRLETVSQKLTDIPSIIIDDEGDQVSPGNEKNKKKPAVIHSSIVQAISNIKTCVYLSVTATPQANLLVSTINGISPDSCVVIEPGDGYTGANTFHDCKDNILVEEISDSDDFEDGIPDSFIKALYFFIVGCAIKRIQGIDDNYSMLVHPSASTRIQHDIYVKINNLINNGISKSADPSSMGYDELIANIEIARETFIPRMLNVPDAAKIAETIKLNLIRLGVFEVNSPSDLDKDQEEFCNYKIYIGGNMLERGITLENLIVTYIYRVAKKDNAVDTMFQRARWFGYKQDYLDVCKVYMPHEMKQMFLDMTNHENYLWHTIKKYLEKSDDIKKFPRVFQLETEGSLILTRKTISKTIKVGGINPGYSYDLSIWYDDENEPKQNMDKWNSFFDTRSGEIIEVGNQEHIVYTVSFTELYEEVLRTYTFPRGARKLNDLYISSLLEAIDGGLQSDEVKIIRMRHKKNQYRSKDLSGRAIKELPQSYDVKSGYPGDKGIYSDILSIQVHYVYTDKSNPDDLIPMLAINNPSDGICVNFVTGDREYGND